MTFLGVPAESMPRSGRSVAADVVVVGAPWEEFGSARPGTALGPSAVRGADYMPQLPVRPHLALGLDPLADLRVVDVGDVGSTPWAFGRAVRQLELAVAGVVAGGAVPVVLGGGQAAAWISLAGAARSDGWAECGLLHLDAHSGPWAGRQAAGVSVPTDRVAQIGQRAWSVGAGDGVPTVWRRDPTEFARHGADTCVRSALDHLSGASRPVFLVVDLDVVEPGMAPGTVSPEPGGLSSRDLLDAVRRAAMELPRLGLALVNLAPPYDRAEVTARLANRVVLEALSGIAWRRRRAGGQTVRQPEWPLLRPSAQPDEGAGD